MMFNPQSFVSLTLRGVVAKLNSNQLNYRKELYSSTNNGKVDAAILMIVLIAKDYWEKNKDTPLLVSDIEKAYKLPNSEWIPNAIIKLRDMKMIKLTFNETVIAPGPEWKENGVNESPGN